MSTAFKGLLVALVAFMVAAPWSAVEAQNRKTGFTIEADSAWRYEDPDGYPSAYKFNFHAWGAISDSGTWGGSGVPNELLLLGNKATYLAVLTLDESSWTFELYDDATGELLGTGTVTARYEVRGRWSHHVYELDGSLVGG